MIAAKINAESGIKGPPVSRQTCGVWRKSVAAAPTRNANRDGKRSTRRADLMTPAKAARLCAAWKYRNDIQ